MKWGREWCVGAAEEDEGEEWKEVGEGGAMDEEKQEVVGRGGGGGIKGIGSVFRCLSHFLGLQFRRVVIMIMIHRAER